jgi:undecaprenyl diphosphate synthase
MTILNENKNIRVFSENDLAKVDMNNIPHHIAIIMDGNRRWSKRKNFSLFSGHWQGAETLIEIVQAAYELGVKVVTVYAFSTENWTRAEREVKDLLSLFEVYLKRKKMSMVEQGVKLSTIGDIEKLPHSLQATIKETCLATQNCEKIELALAINYGARNEILRAIKKICYDVNDNKLNIDELNETVISSYLDTKAKKDPDLLIRTSGELRLSNFMLWQLSYTEVFVTDVLWPDFNKYELIKAIMEYQNRQRRIGGK